MVYFSGGKAPEVKAFYSGNKKQTGAGEIVGSESIGTSARQQKTDEKTHGIRRARGIRSLVWVGSGCSLIPGYKYLRLSRAWQCAGLAHAFAFVGARCAIFFLAVLGDEGGGEVDSRSGFSSRALT